LALGVTPDGLGWRCHRCQASGDGLTLASVVRAGRPLRDLDADRQQEVAIWFLDDGPAFEPSGAVPPRPESGYPPRAEVIALWDAALVADLDPTVVRALGQRGLDARAVARGDVARVLAMDAELPTWAAIGDRSWVKSGHRLIFPLYDADGVHRSVLARSVGDHPAKSVAPRGYRAGALVLANRAGRDLLRGEPHAGETLVISEGEIDLISWTTSHDGPVIGVRSGSWTDAHGERVARTDGPVVIATDLDPTGEEYAAEIVASLPPNALGRVARWPATSDAAPGSADANEYITRGHQLFARGEPLVAGQDTAIPDQGNEVDGQDWQERLKLGRGGAVAGTLANLAMIVSHDAAWAGVVAYDERRARPVFLAEPPWGDDYSGARGGLPRAVTDEDDARLAIWAERQYGASFSPEQARRTVITLAMQQSYDEVRAYFGALVWDGTPRLDAWLVTYLGATASPLVQAVGARWMISAVARTLAPGCKVDSVLVLEGPQGVGKSTAIETLVGRDWYSDELPLLGTKDASLQLLGPMVIELSELDALQRADVTRIKSFLSRGTDRFRPPYGHRTADYPRRVVFAATTNEGAYLRDPTGGRRFWPVRVTETGPIDLVALQRDRDQLWAEAVARYQAGEAWHLHEPQLLAAMEATAAERHEEDPWRAPIAVYLSTLAPPRTTSERILADVLGIEVGDRQQEHARRVAAILRQLGWERRQVRINHRQTWVYVPTRQVVLPPVTSVTTVTTPTNQSAVAGTGSSAAPTPPAAIAVTPVTPVTTPVTPTGGTP
jgi:predicted P-loop ATPase